MAGLKRAGASSERKKKKMKNETSNDAKRIPLELQMDDGVESVAMSKKSRTPKTREFQESGEYVDAAMSSKILKEARRQQEEIQKEIDEEDGLAAARKAFCALGKPEEIDSDSAEDDEDEFLDNKSEYEPTEEISEEEEKLLSMFMAKDGGPQRSLTDMIVKRIRDTNADASIGPERTVPGVDMKVIEVYRGVGTVMSRYTAGKLPKAFKLIVALSNWEEILYITDPEKWSPNAMYQATRIFASNLNARLAQRFYSLVLLPRIRMDIRTHKKLHFSLFQALKKAVYKPAAFYKGILFPLCQSRTCNLREAVIIGSVLQKVSIPSAHSSVAIMKIADMEYSGTNSYFLKLLLDKKYALPYRVLDSVVAHFVRFMDEDRTLPVIWHQCLLTFVQRYKNEFTEEQKENLKKLFRRQKHYLVTPEMQRELQHSRNRGQKEEDVQVMKMVINPTTDEDVWDLPLVQMEED